MQIMLSIVDRMSNETTRIQAIRGLRTIADSPLDLDMTPITTKALPDLASFCRKTDRALRLESLATLAALIQREGRNMDQAALDTVLRCTAPLIKEMDTDPGCAVAALKLAETIVVRKQSWTDVSAIEEVLDAAILAIKQPSLSPGATSALESLLVGIAGLSVENSFVDNSFDTSMLMQRLAGAGTFAAAQCTAALCLASSNQHTDSQMVREITTSLLRRLNEPIGMKSTNSDAAGTTTDYVKQQRYALWSLGELGMRSAVVSKDPDVFAAVSRALTSSKSNELKPQSISPASHSALAGQEGLAVAEAAAFALGGIAAGNLEALLPLLLQQVEAQREDPKTQYQSLRALNRVIETIYRRGHTRNNNNNINESSEVEPSSLGRPEMNDGQVNMILSLLLTLSGPGRQQKFENQGTVLKDATEDSKDKEEECRAMVAECLGRLVLIAPKVVVPAIRNDMLSQSNADPTKRAVAITALKHAVVETRGGWLESELASTLLLALGTTKRDDETDARHGDHLDQEQNQRQIQKEDLDVRKSVVVLLTAVAHNRPALVKLALDGDANPILRGLFAETKQDRSLIRTVDLGPFKHKIDDGLELRKAAFECLGVLMAKCYDRLDPGQVVEALVDGLKDAYDVKMKCHGLLATFASLAPGVVVASLDRFVDPLTQTLNAKVKADAVKQEVDRNEDMIRSCLRAVEVLSHLHGASNVPAFTQFMEQTVRGGTIGPKYAGIEAERRGLRGRTVERRRE